VNELSQRAAVWVFSQSWQILLLVLALAVVWRLSRDASAHCRYLFGLVVLAKCVLPGFISVPLPGSVAAYTPTALSEPARHQGAALSDVPVRGDETSTGALAPRARFPIVGVCTLVWITGVAGMLGLASIKALGIQSTLRRNRAEPDLDLECEFLEMGRRLGLRSRPKLCLLASAGQPFVWGIWRGRIYLPSAFPSQGNTTERQAVLAHELAHVLRWDALVNGFQVLVQALFWFHPAVWWLNARLRQEREKCCDEMAIAALRVDAAAYGTALVDHLVARFNPAVPPSSLAISGKAKELEDRLKTILAPQRRFRLWPSAAAWMGVLLATVLLLPVGVTARRGSLIAGESGAHWRTLSFNLADNRASAGRTFAELPQGEQVYGGVHWVVRGVAAVNGSSAVRVPVEGVFQKLQLLHGLDGAAAPGTTVGVVRFHYRGGRVADLPIRYGEQVAESQFGAFSAVRDPGSAMAWAGGNPETRAAGLGLRLYRSTFVNPRPVMWVEKVEILAGQTQATPLLAAATVE
jgi:beta-lactamase regulating signal transducer with metallopeptidase domain